MSDLQLFPFHRDSVSQRQCTSRRKMLFTVAMLMAGCQATAITTRGAGVPYDGDTTIVCFAPASVGGSVNATITVTTANSNPQLPPSQRFIGPATFNRDTTYDNQAPAGSGNVAYSFLLNNLKLKDSVYVNFGTISKKTIGDAQFTITGQDEVKITN